jgi:hypothetical protein
MLSLCVYFRRLRINQLSGTIPSALGSLTSLDLLCVPHGSAGRGGADT